MRGLSGNCDGRTFSKVWLAGFVLAGAGLSGCAGANRLDAFAPPFRASSAPVYQSPDSGFPRGSAQAGPGVIAGNPVNTAPVTSQALPPPGGQPPASGATLPGSVAAPVDPQLAQAGAQAAPGQAERVVETPTMSGGARQVATLGERPASGGRGGPVTSRDGVVGGWTAREATGGTCRVTLSSSPALDLYRASASGCANKDLQKVSAWDYRNGEVYLYQPGGAVAARMRVDDGGSLSGSIARSGAGLSMAR